jgi:hypothetical protein
MQWAAEFGQGHGWNSQPTIALMNRSKIQNRLHNTHWHNFVQCTETRMIHRSIHLQIEIEFEGSQEIDFRRQLTERESHLRPPFKGWDQHNYFAKQDMHIYRL